MKTNEEMVQKLIDQVQEGQYGTKNRSRLLLRLEELKELAKVSDDNRNALKLKDTQWKEALRKAFNNNPRLIKVEGNSGLWINAKDLEQALKDQGINLD